MADEAIAYGSTFSMGNPTTLLKLANIEEFPNLPSYSRQLLDTSNFETPDAFKTYITSPWKEGSEDEVVMKIALGSASDTACRNAMLDGKPRPVKIVATTASGTWEVTFNIIVLNYVRTNPKADIRMATLSYKVVSLAAEAAGTTAP